MPVRRFAAVALALVLAAGAAGWWWWRSEPGLPVRIAIEDALADFSASFDRASVVEETAEAPVREAGIQPSPYLDAQGGYRRALVVPPPARLRFRAHVPADAQLRFGAGVEGDAKRNTEKSGIRFAVTVDGAEVYSRLVNPARTRYDRRWFDERLDLSRWAERDVDIELTTTAARPGVELAGTAGWSQVRLVRERLRDRQAASPAQPNVLVLLVDTLRADRLGCYGASPSPSPTLDGLAARGLVFEEAIAQASWTIPSVASIMTGLLPQSHGMIGETRGWQAPPGDVDHRDPSFLADSLYTLAEHAQEAGITTMGVAANPIVSRGNNMAQGFETFVELPGTPGGPLWAHAAEVNRRFLEWLGRNRGYRFLGYLHYMDVHDPYEPPEAFRPPPPPGIRPLAAQGKMNKLAHQVNWEGAPPLSDADLGYLRALYDAGIRSWDAELARLLAGLAAAGVLDSTVVVVTADHGEAFQEHGKLAHGMHLYEELLHVPLVVAGASTHAARLPGEAQSIDVFPTAAALLGLPAPPALAGQNLLGAREPHPALSHTRWGILPDGRAAEIVSLRTPEWKLIRAPADTHVELFDLAHDPRERENVFGRAPEGERLTTLLARMQAEAPPPPRTTGHDPALREKLRALGYVD